MHNFIKLMYSCGARPGELVSLTLDDINFDRKQITINKTTVNGVVGLTKT